MKTMRRTHVWLAAALGAIAASAATPAPEQLVPADTLAVLAIPDFAQVRAAQKASPMALLWQDAALTPFREKFMNQLTKKVIEPVEKELGLKLQDYADIVQGQLTAALTRNGWNGTVDPLPGLLVIVDSRDKKDLLRKNLEDARKKLSEAGHQSRTERIRDVEFTVVTVDPEKLKEAFESDEAMPKLEVAFGQSDSLLLVGTNLKDIEKVLIRTSGGSAPCLADQPAFQANASALFRNPMSYGWIHFTPLAEIITRLAKESAAARGGNPGVPSPDQIINAIGLNGLKTLAFAGRTSTEGDSADLMLGVPDDGRRGVFKMMATEAKDAAPPAFVPIEAVAFNRWRLDGQKCWAALDATVNEISPGGLQGVLGMINEMAKQKDPNFDFARLLVGNLGDDLISYSKAPRGTSLEELGAQPSIFLLGAPKADELLQGIRSLLAGAMSNPMLPIGGGEVKEREFLGRKIYSLALPGMTGPGGAERSLMMAASGGYVAFSTDTAILEEYLRSGDSRPKPLASMPGLTDAAQKVGGTATGLFGFQNDKENMRSVYEAVRTNDEVINSVFSGITGGGEAGALKDWLDFSLLPPFDRVAKYFGISVFAGSMARDGYLMKVFTPIPATARQ